MDVVIIEGVRIEAAERTLLPSSLIVRGGSVILALRRLVGFVLVGLSEVALYFSLVGQK